MADKPEVKIEAVDSVVVQNEILRRIAKLEKNQKVIVKWARFCEKTIKPIYGLASVGACFGQLAEKLDA
jgi:hypothetical protein